MSEAVINFLRRTGTDIFSTAPHRFGGGSIVMAGQPGRYYYSLLTHEYPIYPADMPTAAIYQDTIPTDSIVYKCSWLDCVNTGWVEVGFQFDNDTVKSYFAWRMTSAGAAYMRERFPPAYIDSDRFDAVKPEVFARAYG